MLHNSCIGKDEGLGCAFLRSMFDDYPCILEAMKWSKRNPAALHPLVRAARNSRYDLVDLPEVEAKLVRLKLGSLLTEDLKRHLTNPKQFFPAMAEVDVIIHLMDHGLEAQWGSDPPDIEIYNLQTDIEVKSLSVADKLKDAKSGEVVELDDTSRMRARIRRDVLPRIRNNQTYVLVFLAEGFGFDELEDLFIYGDYVADHEAQVFRPQHSGLFYHLECNPISAVVLMKEPFLWPCRKRIPFASRSPAFAGILNPNSKKDVPAALQKAFNIVSLNELRRMGSK